MDGFEKDKSGELDPSLAMALKSAEISSEESTVITTAVVCAIQENYKNITPNTSPQPLHVVEDKMEESPGKSPQVHNFNELCFNWPYCIWVSHIHLCLQLTSKVMLCCWTGVWTCQHWAAQRKHHSPSNDPRLWLAWIHFDVVIKTRVTSLSLSFLSPWLPVKEDFNLV